MDNIEYTISRIKIDTDNGYIGTGNYEITVYGFENGSNSELELEFEECISIEEVIKFIKRLDKVYMGIKNLSWTDIMNNEDYIHV